MNTEETRRLIDSLLDGDISEADFLRIEAELSVDPAVRREYYDRLTLSVLLEESQAESQPAATPGAATVAQLATKPPAAVPSSAATWRRAFLAMAATAVAMVAVIGWLLTFGSGGAGNASSRNNLAEAQTEEQASGFAVVAGQSMAVWEDGVSLANGALLPAGTLRLESGIVQLEVFSGVTVVLDGPAEFAILSPMEMTVSGGKMRAHVPEPAHGFRVRTNEGDVVDLGTDFAVNVVDGQSEVHVLDGEVEWHPRSDTIRRMEKGEGVRWSADGNGLEIEADSAAFVAPDELRHQLAWAKDQKREQWLRFSNAARSDPGLVAFYQVASGNRWSRHLANLAAGRSIIAGEGAVVAAARSSDRWGQPDGSLDFSPTGSRVRLFVPGTHRSLTLLCWVKINSLDRWYNSLFLTDGHDLHEPHWQIMDDGRLFFSVKKRDRWDSRKGEKDKHVFHSPPFWNASLSGQWLMLATVYDVDDRQVTHYLNGEVLSQEAIPSEYVVEEVSIGNASLGNWGLPERDDPNFAVRNFNGTMDEFMLFSEALTAEEITEYYEVGKP